MRNLGIVSNEDLDFVKTRTKEAALSSYRNDNNNFEFLALHYLPKNKNIRIQKSDRTNSLVIVDKGNYLDIMENLLNNTRKFEKLDLNQEKRVNNILKNCFV